ncbi:Gfo/Idh/MocA family protein [Nonomuraea sp. NPDC050328]|uniref:Gfo/Idh/MocA family protein n=1 Tax=Nonomuraea sp. NPDC050328 TaxID=3364361 RepID=UPI0037AD041C
MPPASNCRPVGVGIVGSGPGAAAVHLPTLARLGEVARIVHIADRSGEGSRALAQRVGARSSTGLSGVLADPEAEVVVLCTPPAQHAAQIRRCVTAGKRAILCEKPLAETTADAVHAVTACREAGVALVVGTHHAFDPSWSRVRDRLAGHRLRSVVVTASLPPNDRYHDVVTEGVALPDRGRPRSSEDRAGQAAALRRLVLGLGIHDVPLLRALAPGRLRVEYARLLSPLGYALGYRAGDVLVALTVVMTTGGADALWHLRAVAGHERVDLMFPPAFVSAGAAVARIRTPESEYRLPRSPVDGYLAEWQALLARLDGDEVTDYDSILHDARYGIELADAAAAHLLGTIPR